MTDLAAYPLCSYFLAGYLSRTDDPSNFPTSNMPGLLDRYEQVFEAGLVALGTTREALRSRSDFRFDSGDAANLEAGIAILRVAEALRIQGFHDIKLVAPRNDGTQAADLLCEKNGQRICCEVKAITKQSKGRPGFFLAQQLYQKILEHIDGARAQLSATASALNCSVTIYACVINWFEQSIYLTKDDYQMIVNWLERDQDQESLLGIDGVFFVTQQGLMHLFLNLARGMHEVLAIPK